MKSLKYLGIAVGVGIMIGLVAAFGFWPILAVIVGVALNQLKNLNKGD